MEITDVGLAMDTLVYDGTLVCGTMHVYSEEDGEEYVDDFKFTYDTKTGLITTGVDIGVFGEYIAEIEEMLVDNLRTNFLK